MRGDLINFSTKHASVGGLPDLTTDVLEAAFHQDNNAHFVDELYNHLRGEEAVVVSDDEGTNIRIVYGHGKHPLVKSDGFLHHGKFANPIPAEVYCHPIDVEGTMIIRGAYGPLSGHPRFSGNFKSLKNALNSNPMTWRIKDSKISDISCDDKEIEAYVLKEIFVKDKQWGPQIGEFGMPANLFVLARDLTGNLMIDEKGRVHLAHGDGYGPKTNCRYTSPVHGDGLIARATVTGLTSGKIIMKDNKYNSSVFPSLQKQPFK